MGSYRLWKAAFKQFTQSFWAPFLLILLFLICAVAIQRHYQNKEIKENERTESLPGGQSEKNAVRNVLKSDADSLKQVVGAALTAQGLSWKESATGSRPERWSTEVPSHLPIPSVHQQIQNQVFNAGGSILSAVSNPVSGKVELRIGKGDSCLFILTLCRPKVEKTESGCLAVVIDDFGDRHDSMVESFLGLDIPITFSVLPGRKYSSRIARESTAHGHEIILHLTMEPLNESFKDDGFVVLKGMPPSQIREVVERSVKEVPGALGVNNHMGSKATQDRPTMTSVLQAIGEHQLFFMDSYTIATSIAYPLAREIGLRSAKRDVFLDVSDGEDAIRQKLRELARRARKNGSAIGIGHCHRAMFNALEAEIPILRAEGYRFVFLSELVQ
jgi:polysaccharide deacetylase 2 family uncharacterized protein YibQ